MGTATAEREMVRRNDVSVKVAPDVLKLARAIAVYRGTSIAEYLSDTLRPIVQEHHAAELRKLAGEASKPSKPEGPKRPKGSAQ